jgi:hypothetical protein
VVAPNAVRWSTPRVDQCSVRRSTLGSQAPAFPAQERTPKLLAERHSRQVVEQGCSPERASELSDVGADRPELKLSDVGADRPELKLSDARTTGPSWSGPTRAHHGAELERSTACAPPGPSWSCSTWEPRGPS